MVIKKKTIQNLRDLGGMKTKDGRKIRTGCLLRSANLFEASDEDIQSLQSEQRLRTIIDLRTAQEREEKPDRTGNCRYLPMPIIDTFEAGITHESRTEKMPFPDLRELYKRMMLNEKCQKAFYQVLKICFEHDYDLGSVLWHCTEGKDRCGMRRTDRCR